jgi:DNA polymerase bacteriophage-type
VKTLSLDLETYSSVDLGKSSVYRYVESPDFDILLLGYSVDGGDVQVVVLAQGEQIPPDIIDALTDVRVRKWAFNANFERVCLSEWLRRHGYSLRNERYSTLDDPCMGYLDSSSWYCTMVWSAYLGLPLSLKDVGTVLGLDKQKLTEGKDLIRYFCTPGKDDQRHIPTDAPDKWQTFKAYNLRDVETEMAIQERLQKYPVPDDVWEQYHLDQQINDRGIAVDMQLVRNAIAIDERSHEELNSKLQELTMLENPNSVQQMKNWLSENGLETDTLGKKQVTELLKTAPEPLKSVLLLRQQLAKSSVKKYQAMEATVCTDGRVRGCFQFYGANRTGRYSGRNIQLQNLPQNHMPDLAEARSLVKSGDYEALRLLYDSTPDVLSQLIRTAFVPHSGRTFFVADFSAIEARVIAWLAGEEWRMELFRNGGDIYCMSASQMFKVPVEKHGINGHLRQRGKVAELACIAEGQLVLTDDGLVPIQDVTTEMKVWDGESWVTHEGLAYRGEKEVITYEGLTATPDHLVWVEGQSQPVQFGIAAASGAHLVQTGNGGNAIRLGEDHQCGETLEQDLESMLCSDSMHELRNYPMAKSKQSTAWKIQRMSGMLATETDTTVAGQKTDGCKAAMRKSICSRVQQLWRAWNPISIFKHTCCWLVSHKHIWNAGANNAVGSDRHQWALRTGQHPLCYTKRESSKSPHHSAKRVQSSLLAVCSQCGGKETCSRANTSRNHSGCGISGIRETKELASHQRKARVYDIRNAGEHHRFTVSGKLVHNCGYGGSVGALKAMGAMEMGLKEEELKPLVDAWRKANPHIVQLWWDVDEAVHRAIAQKCTIVTHGLKFSCQSGMLFITLPSGRNLSYVKPRIGENSFGGSAITYMGTDATHRWTRLESYGPKVVENLVQGISRDILCYAMQTLRDCSIVAHVHDELIIEADPRMSLDAVCEQMGRTPPWAEGLLLRADGYVTPFYKKD